MPDTRYLALSHFLGRSTFLTLKSSNLRLFLDGIEVPVLFQNFQDAIKVSRQLNSSYPWIDSLCISQDNIDDWNIEAPPWEMPMQMQIALLLQQRHGIAARHSPQLKLISPSCGSGRPKGSKFESIYALPDAKFTISTGRETSCAQFNYKIVSAGNETLQENALV